MVIRQMCAGSLWRRVCASIGNRKLIVEVAERARSIGQFPEIVSVGIPLWMGDFLPAVFTKPIVNEACELIERQLWHLRVVLGNGLADFLSDT